MRDGDLWNRLNKTEQEELLDTLEESGDPENLLDHEAMKSKHQKWL
ncbi:MAG: hypothetical protein KDC05_11325 [Bacteroidales bacterium]|nr:hypothetical protein [Bacteroidales bacterium]